ncbi:MAG: type II toxin-antitoxin system RelB/DinJ family antitoxin [Peptococcaceae bacterium]|jgi:DNA-damage-inducible protein J|nr:type II toxin-antitoxin system RelB/DinJ family antitoxin [Peptococcaceae bacterium]
MKTTNYNIRVNPEIKKQAEQTFAAFGLNLSEAINIFLHKSIMVHGLPFNVREDDYQFISPLPETEYSKPFDNLEDLWKELGI